MAAKLYTVYASIQGQPVTGLTPTIDKLANLSSGADIASKPSVSEVSSTNSPGFYKFTYDPDVQAVGRVDLGSASSYDGGRYIPVACL